MFTDKNGAYANMIALKKYLGPSYNKEEIHYEYLLNPSHIAGLGDVFAVAYQKLFEQENVSDYDLVEMIKDASDKVKTKKVLLVAHSQGNFYANSFYEEVSGLNIGSRKKVPMQSMEIYGVATPASHQTGLNSRYITSGSDKVMNKVRTAGVLDVLPANVDIKLAPGDDPNGHSFSDVYLKYQASRIISDIKTTLDQLSPSTLQDENSPCIAAPELTFVHKLEGAALAVADPTAIVLKQGTIAVAKSTYNVGLAIGNAYLSLIEGTGKLLANAVGALPDDPPEIPLVVNHTASASESKTKEPAEDIQVAIQTSEAENPSISTTEETPPYVVQEPAPESITIAPSPIIPPVSTSFRAFGTWGSGGPAAANIAAAASEPEPGADPEPDPTPDTAAPVITIDGDNPVSVDTNAVYTDAGATAEDAVDGVVTVSASGAVDTSTVGTYTITYVAQDAVGNVATTTRIVNVSTPLPTVLAGHMETSGAFVFDTPGTLHNINTYIYRGHYPDTSDVIAIPFSAPIEVASSNTPGCGSICVSRIGEYYWFDVNSDEGHFIFELRRTGALWEWEVINPFSTVVLSSQKQITSFQFYISSLSNTFSGVIDQDMHTISMSLPSGVDITALSPGILTSDLAFISPGDHVVQDFTNPVTYTVSAQDHSTQNYTVTVTVDP